MGLSFQCEYENVPLCMNAATCLRTNSTETCVCPSGYMHDYVFGHFTNCSLPEDALLAIFVTFSIVFFLCIVTLARYFIVVTGRPLKRLLAMQIVNVSLDWLHIIAVYIERGAFEAAGIFAGLSCIGISLLAIEGSALFLAPMLTITPQLLQRMRRNFYLAEFISSVFWAISFGGLAGSSRLENQEVHNGFFTFALVQVILQTIFLVLVVTRAMSQLEERIVAANSNPATAKNHSSDALAGRLRFARKGLLIATVLEIIPLIPLPIINVIFGSVPYMWVFWVVMLCINLPTTFAVCVVAAKQQQPGSLRWLCCKNFLRAIPTSSVKVDAEVDVAPIVPSSLKESG